MAKFLTEFKEFALKGNVVDMAVGIIIGGAFSAIVTSLVNDIIMPVVGVLTGGTNFSEFKFVIQKGVTQGTEVITPEVAITWGSFVQTVVDFLIIAFCIFLAIKLVNRLRHQKTQEEAPAAPAGPTQEELLTQIRDILERDSKASASAPHDK